MWLSLVEYLNGVQVAAGSNPVTPTKAFDECQMPFFVAKTRLTAAKARKHIVFSCIPKCFRILQSYANDMPPAYHLNAPALVRIQSLRPRRSKVRVASIFYAKKSFACFLASPFHKKPRSARLIGCKRSLTTARCR